MRTLFRLRNLPLTEPPTRPQGRHIAPASFDNDRREYVAQQFGRDVVQSMPRHRAEGGAR